MSLGNEASMLMLTRLAILILGVTGFIANPVVEPIAIYISGPTDAIKPGSDLAIHIVLTNTSDKDIKIPRIVNDSDAELNYSIKLRDEENNDVADTEYGASYKNKQIIIVSRTVVTLHPNESAAPETAVINKLFVLTPGHTYTVQVEREYPSGSRAWVKSNSIKLLVSK